MEGKKKYVVIALLLLLGFGAISFAGGGEDELDPMNDNTSDVDKDGVMDDGADSNDNTVEFDEEEEEDEIVNQVIVPVENQGAVNNNFGNNGEGEETPVVINPTSYVAAVEQMIYGATNKDNVGEAKTYYGDNKVKELVDALEDGELKEDLTQRVEKLEKVFEDSEGPSISGIENGAVTKEDVQITVTDELDHKVEITKNGEPYESNNIFTEEGTYKIVATDLAQNTTELTFTIDKSVPVLSYSTVRLNKTGYLVGTYNKYTTNYYVTDGDKFTYAIAFEEKLLNAPKLTIGGKDVTLSLVDKETLKDGERIYLYEGIMEVLKEDNLEQGELKVVLSEIVDEAGNEVIDETILKPVQTTNNRVIVYDNVAPKLSYIAMLAKNEDYTKAIKGDTIRFLVRFNEEIDLNSKTFKLKFDGKEINFIKSQDVGYEYIVDYTIPSDSKMETGDLKFEIYGYTDKAGNGGDVLTVANHSKYNKVYYDGIAPTIKLVGTLGKNQNEHRVPVGSWIDLSVLKATVTDNSLEEAIEINPDSILKCYPSTMNKACHDYEIDEDTLFDTDTVGVRYNITYSYTDDSGYTTTRTMLLVIDDFINPVAVDKGDYREINVIKNINNGYLPFYNEFNNDKDLVINGNGHTVTQNVQDFTFYWDDIYSDGVTNRPVLSNLFTSTSYKKITLNDLTFKGTTQFISFGHWNNANYESNRDYKFEVNNVNIIGLEYFSRLSVGVSPAVLAYGNYTFNNVNIYDNYLCDRFKVSADKEWDLVANNYSDGYIKNSKIGSIRTYEYAKLTLENSEVELLQVGAQKKKDGVVTVKAGTVIDKLIIGSSSVVLNIEEGAIVKELDYNDKKVSGLTLNIADGTVLSEVNKK